MDQAELSFNAWILVGNVLNAALRGDTPTSPGRDRDTLQRLDSLLEPLQPGDMLQTLQTLPPSDRQSLLAACLVAQAVAGPDTESTLGLGQNEIEQVIARLGSQT